LIVTEQVVAMRSRCQSERDQLDLFWAVPGDRHANSSSLSPLNYFAYDRREIVRWQALPGCQLVIAHDRHGAEQLHFVPVPVDISADRLRKYGSAL
jgi:hypothetical protein